MAARNSSQVTTDQRGRLPARSGESAARERSSTIAAVERAADVLLLFAESTRQTLGVTEVSDELGMSKTAVHRILASLRSRHLIDLDGQTHRYRLGTQAMVLGLRYLGRLDVRQLALPHLHELSAETNETATLSVRTGDTRVYIDQVPPLREVMMSVSIGVPFPLHAGASSKAFLAFLPKEDLAAYLLRHLTALTDRTITDREELERELGLIRDRGWAHSNGERQIGASSIAAPIFDHQARPIAVISLCGPAERFESVYLSSVERLLRVTNALSTSMGHSSSIHSA